MVKGNVSATISSIAVGDKVLVQGSVSGTSITASSVIDQAKPNGNGGENGEGNGNAHPGFFGSIGGFFKHLFGF
jgi:hypothetical protein